jgi:hypothetical protein
MAHQDSVLVLGWRRGGWDSRARRRHPSSGPAAMSDRDSSIPAQWGHGWHQGEVECGAWEVGKSWPMDIGDCGRRRERFGCRLTAPVALFLDFQEEKERQR